MKKIVCLLFVAAVAISGGCKKDKTGQQNQSRLEGTWDLQQRVFIRYENATEVLREETPIAKGEMQFIFKGDTLALFQNGQADAKYPFQQAGDSLKLKEGAEEISLKVRWNTPSQIVLSNEDIRVRNNITRRDVEEYHLNKQ